MFGIGSTELLIILAVGLIILGPKKLPQIARTLGKGMAEFKKVSTDLQRTINVEVEREERDQKRREEEKAKTQEKAKAAKSKHKGESEESAKARQEAEEAASKALSSADKANRTEPFKDPYAEQKEADNVAVKDDDAKTIDASSEPKAAAADGTDTPAGADQESKA